MSSRQIPLSPSGRERVTAHHGSHDIEIILVVIEWTHNGLATGPWHSLLPNSERDSGLAAYVGRFRGAAPCSVSSPRTDFFSYFTAVRKLAIPDTLPWLLDYQVFAATSAAAWLDMVEFSSHTSRPAKNYTKCHLLELAPEWCVLIYEYIPSPFRDHTFKFKNRPTNIDRPHPPTMLDPLLRT